MADEPKPGVVQTRLGPLPEDFFGLEPKAKLQALLAQAHDIRRRAKDDEDGQNQRWYADQVVLGAVWEYVRDDAPPEHLHPLVRLAENLDDLKRGRQPKEMKPALRPERANPGLETHRATTLATACAIVDVLSKDRGPGCLIKHIEEEVAGAIGEQLGAFQSWRKAFKAGRRGPQARDAYDDILRMLQERPDPKLAARILLETHRGGH
jgi:hypothetical protein